MFPLIRPLEAGDLAAYRELRLLGLRESPTAFGASLRQESHHTDADVLARLAPAENRWILGAFDAAGGLHGLLGFVRDGGDKSAHKGFLWGMYVRPDQRGRGLARALLRDMLARTDRLAASGLRRVRLSVVSTNLPALRLYEAHGFTRYGEEREALCVDGVFHDELHLVRVTPGV